MLKMKKGLTSDPWLGEKIVTHETENVKRNLKNFLENYFLCSFHGMPETVV